MQLVAAGGAAIAPDEVLLDGLLAVIDSGDGLGLDKSSGDGLFSLEEGEVGALGELERPRGCLNRIRAGRLIHGLKINLLWIPTGQEGSVCGRVGSAPKLLNSISTLSIHSNQITNRMLWQCFQNTSLIKFNYKTMSRVQAAPVFSLDVKIGGKKVSMPVYAADTHDSLVNRFCDQHLVKEDYKDAVKDKIIGTLLQILQQGKVGSDIQAKITNFVN